MFGDDGAPSICSLTVYAIATRTARAPRIVVAMDFSETSLRAARLSLAVAARGGAFTSPTSRHATARGLTAW
jgi:hypothetical protein